MKDNTYIFMGRSGSGKGTQIALLKQYMDDADIGEVYQLEAGDRFRDFFERKTYSSKLAEKISNKGELVPSFLAIWAWGEELIEHMEKDTILMIDGIPRKKDEARILKEALNFYGRDKIKVILIDVSNNWALDKMTHRMRKDDKTSESRKKRLDWFEKSVIPVLEDFKEDPNFEVIKINGEQDIKAVHDEIIQKINI